MPHVALRLGAGVAISTALYGLACAFPLAAPVALLVPLPGLVVATRAPSSECSLWFFLTTITVGALLGADAIAGFVLPFGFPTLVLAVGIRRFWSFERTVLAGVAVWSAGIACLLLLAYGGFDAAATAVRDQVAHSVDFALSTYGSLGVPEHTLALAQVERDPIIAGFMDILPAMAVLTGLAVVLANMLLLRAWADLGRHVNLRLWRAPDALIWALIAAGFGMFVPTQPIASTARNLFLVLLACYFCQGLAIVSYYLDRFRLPRGLRIAGYVLIGVQHVVTAIVLVLGIFDLWGNFRRLSAGSAGVQFHSDGE
ncbi:MAG TPA: DUF2232 domain-containing protein [Candidatus Margulisiibacteriota bacterium]|nr:DUF2232 domain-containing protein [Candidatus Margulisiibacteriota bacterium]